jgi:hypothetical protein
MNILTFFGKTAKKQPAEPRTMLSDCRLMLRYALDEGCQVPVPLGADIVKIDAFLIAAGDALLSEIPSDLTKVEKPPFPVAPAPPQDETLNAIILRAHNALSNLVVPATALSLRATDPELFWFGMPRIVQWAIYGALVFMVWFIICASNEVKKSNDETSGQKAETTASPSSSPTQVTPSPSPRNP